MKYKRTITIAATVVALAIIATFLVFRDTQIVKAQEQVPPPVPERISFGVAGITSGQTVRVTVSDTLTPNDSGWPPGPVRVALTFRYGNGNLVRDARTNDVIRRVVDLERGDTTFLDIDYIDLPPGPSRAQLRAVVVVTPPPVGDQPPPVTDRVVASVEVINTSTGRTLFMNPAVIRGFNPQPDPPMPE